MANSHAISRRSLFGAALAAVTVVRARPGLAAPALWPNGSRGAVSLTYDDGLNSQLEYAVPELDRRGLKATFFLTEENMEARLADWVAVAREGHEVANHTVTHPCSLGRFSASRFEHNELDRMEGFLDQNFGAERTHTFAYPCGFLGIGHGDRRERFGRYRRLLQKTDLVAARTTAGAPNHPAQAVTDPFHLHAFEPTYEADTVLPGYRYLNETVAMGGWAILVFHEVMPQWRGEGDASVAVHGRILDHIERMGLWCAPMGEVFDHLHRRV